MLPPTNIKIFETKILYEISISNQLIQWIIRLILLDDLNALKT